MYTLHRSVTLGFNKGDLGVQHDDKKICLSLVYPSPFRSLFSTFLLLISVIVPVAQVIELFAHNPLVPGSNLSQDKKLFFSFLRQILHFFGDHR